MMKLNVWMLVLMTSLAVAATAEAQPGGGGGGRGRGMWGGGGGGGGSLWRIIGNDAVQKDLGLSTDEAEKVKAVTDSYREAVGQFPDVRSMSEEERTKAMEKFGESAKAASEKFLPKLKDALSASQFTRLQQINWQNMGTAALSDAEIVKALPIAKDQQDKIKAITTEYDAKRDEMFAAARSGGGGREAFQGMREKMQTMDKERDTKITEVLTKDQQDKFASLKGKEFDVEQLRGGPGGPGGRRGGGGGGGGGGAGAEGGGRPKRPQPKAE